jgi:hypothetical protein
MSVAERDLLDEPRAERPLLQFEARDRAAVRMRSGVDVRPLRIGRPAMRRNVRIVGGAERRAEEVAGEEAEVGKDGLVVCDRRIVNPWGGVKGRDFPAARLELDGARMSDREIDDDARSLARTS